MGGRESIHQATVAPRRPLSVLLPWFITASLYALLLVLFSTPFLQYSTTSVFTIGKVYRYSACAALSEPTPVANRRRTVSDRFVEGSLDTLILNATIWTGNDTLTGDILLSKGLISDIGNLSELAKEPSHSMHVIHAGGAWVTPGLVDLDSHAGVQSIPIRPSANSLDEKGPHPLVFRTIDAFTTHDPAFFMAAVGGVTAAHIAPDLKHLRWTAGQAFVIKHRRTKEGSAASMVVEPPWNSTSAYYHIAHRVDGAEAVWKLEKAYRQASQIRVAQDEFCSGLLSGDELRDHFPQDAALEPLVDVLRGRAKVAIYASEVASLAAVVRLSNEFKFSVTTVQNADEAWLAPSILNQTFGTQPVIGLASTRHRTSLESYRGSAFAPQVLSDVGYRVAMETGHPSVNGRYLLQEAQIAHHYGLSARKALASITTIPSEALGLAHRIGWLRTGHDADVVLWNGSPLQLGTVPQMVWIDGMLMVNSSGSARPSSPRLRSVMPSWAKERDAARIWDGLPPVGGGKQTGTVVFKTVNTLWTRKNGQIKEDKSLHSKDGVGSKRYGTVAVNDGKITCVGRCQEEGETIDLEGGSISPGFMTFGSALGLGEIEDDVSTGTGPSYDPFSANTPLIVGDVAGISRASDSLQFGTQDALLAYRSGVTMATSHLPGSPKMGGFAIQGVSATFETGSDHLLARGAMIQDKVALHVSVRRADQGKMGIGSIVSVIRRLLLHSDTTNTETERMFREAATGVIPFVVAVDDADIMALLVKVKYEVEDLRGSTMRMVFFGGAEAHLIVDCSWRKDRRHTQSIEAIANVLG